MRTLRCIGLPSVLTGVTGNKSIVIFDKFPSRISITIETGVSSAQITLVNQNHIMFADDIRTAAGMIAPELFAPIRNNFQCPDLGGPNWTILRSLFDVIFQFSTGLINFSFILSIADLEKLRDMLEPGKEAEL